jgi:hypothetical protein
MLHRVRPLRLIALGHLDDPPKPFAPDFDDVFGAAFKREGTQSK